MDDNTFLHLNFKCSNTNCIHQFRRLTKEHCITGFCSAPAGTIEMKARPLQNKAVLECSCFVLAKDMEL